MKKEVKIGIFAVAMIGAAWAGIRFLKGFDIFSTNKEYYAAYDQISGVQSASPIMMRGVKIGAVTGISFDPSTSDKVVLRFTINNKYRIPRDSEAKIFSNGLMGDKAVEIIYGTSREYLNEGDTLRSGHDRDLMDMAGSELEFFKQKFSQLTSDLSRTLTDISETLEENRTHLNHTMRNVSSITTDVDRLLHQEREHLAEAIGNFSEFSRTLGQNSDRINNIVTDIESFTGTLTEEQVARKLDESLAGIDSLLADINRGQGTLGLLMKDPGLYRSLNEASENLAVLLADLKKYPGRYVHLSLFGRDPEKMKAKADKRAAKEEARRLRDSLRNVQE